MKRFLLVLGCITLLLIILIVGFIGYSAIKGHQLDVSSKAYVDANIPTIISTWSKEELKKRGSKELQEELTDQNWNLFLAKVKQLGKFQTYEGCKGQAYMSQNNLNPEIVTAEYRASADFQNGQAEIKMELVWRNSQWQIVFLDVDSPIFKK